MFRRHEFAVAIIVEFMTNCFNSDLSFQRRCLHTGIKENWALPQAAILFD